MISYVFFAALGLLGLELHRCFVRHRPLTDARLFAMGLLTCIVLATCLLSIF